MIRFLTHDQVDSEQWDKCIGQAVNGSIYVYSWYLNMVCPGWCALVEDEYRIVMPLPAWQKMKIQYLVQPLFTQQLGIYSSGSISTREVKDFLYKIPGRFKYVDFNLNSANKIETSGLKYKFNINYELSLEAPYEQLVNSYSDNLKRNLRKAGKYPLRLSKSADPEAIIDLFRKFRGSEIKNLSDKQYEILLNLLKMLLHKGICQVWGVFDEDEKLIGGVAWVFSHKRAVFLFSAVSDLGKQRGAMPFMIDRFISENAGKELILDFEGSNNEKLGRFYAGFGSKKLFYPRIYYNHLPFYTRIGLAIYREFRSLMKK